MDTNEREELRVFYAQKAKRHNEWLVEKICEMIQVKRDTIKRGIDVRGEISTLTDVLRLLDTNESLEVYNNKLLDILILKIVKYQGKFYDSMVSGNKFDEGRYSACEDIGKMIRELMKE